MNNRTKTVMRANSVPGNYIVLDLKSLAKPMVCGLF